jgi:hypothetical protein
VPQDDLGLCQRRCLVAAERAVRVPHRHALQRYTELLGGVPPEVLIGEEQHPLAALERPPEHGLRVARGADDPAVPAAEPLQRGGGVHVGDGDDRHEAVGVRLGPVQRLERLPGLLDLVDVRHVGHRAPGREVRQDHGLIRPRQEVGGLGHEVHATEDDGLRLGAGLGGVRQLEGVADVVRVLDDLVALVEVPEDHDAVAEGLLRGDDASVEVFGGRVPVGDRQLPLAR